MMKIIILTFFLTLTCSIGFAQNKLTDSLKHQLAIAKSDTSRVLIMSSICNTLGGSNPDSALYYGEKALALARKINFPKGEIRALSFTSGVLNNTGNLPKALSMAFEALQIAEKNKLDREKQWPFIYISAVYHTIQDFPKAISFRSKALQIAEAASNTSSMSIENSNMGNLYSETGQLDSALFFLNRSLVLSNGEGSNLTFRALGDIQAKKGNYDIAMNYYQKSIEIATYYNSRRNIAPSYLSIAKLYKSKNQRDSSIYYAEKALAESQPILYKRMVIEASTLLSELYEPINNKESYRYYKLATTTKESLFGAGNIQAIQVMIAQVEERQKEVEAEKIANQNKLRQYGLLAGLAMFLLISFILYRNNRQKQKANVVLENTLTDLKTSQTQLELKNRDLEIEGALERVRARTMAMQKSEELSEVSYLLNKQVVELGIPTWGCAFNIYNENDSTEWFSSLEVTIPAYHTPRENIFLKYYEAGQRGESLLIEEFGGERIKGLYKYFATLNDSGDETINNHVANAPNYQINHMAYFKYGYLLFITPEPAPEAHDVFKRFAKVFEQTYTRFLDLQKAEAQAREAEIEAALERVRSRTMAMQKSDELTEVAGILFKQVTDMGIKLWTAGFNVWSEDNNSYVDYLTSPLGDFIEPYTVNATEFSVFVEISDAKKRGEEFLVQYLEGDLLKQLYLELSKFGDEKQYELMVQDGFQLPSHQYDHFVFGSKVSLMFITYEAVPEAYDIFKRFGKVFEQTYTRFLDLQKAEAQAREAQIEAALERVRSRTMAMQHSKELAETASLLFKQVIDLGVNAFAITFQFWLEDGISTTCWTSVGDGMQPSFRIPHTEEPFHHQIYKAWKKGEDFFVMETEGEELEDVYRYVAMQMDEEVLNIMENSEFSIPKFQVVHCVFFLQGYINIMTYERTPEAHDIFKRFGKVFEQSYTRFLDLQKAEAQTREAHLEASFERIRSRAMAMDTSDELNALIGFVYSECSRLDMNLDRSLIMTFDKVTNDTRWWMAGPEASDVAMSYLVKYHEYDPSLAFLKGWHDREQKWSYLYEGENKKNWDKYCFEETGLVEMPEPMKAGMRAQKSIILNASFQNFGCVILSTHEPMSDEHFDLLVRLSKVFDLAYTRFLDLQLKEQNALKLIEEKQKLEQTLTELRVTQTQLIQKEKLASLGELTAGIAHEIQNPLNFVNNFSEVSAELVDEMNQELEKGDIIEAKEIANDLKQNLEKINLHGKRASSIVKGMLEHSRTSSGVKELTDINKLADEYLRLSCHGLRAKDNSFNSNYQTDFDENLPKINVISQDMGRVLLNLINNAFWAVASASLSHRENYKPLVTVKTEQTDNQIIIKVSDNGIGMTDDVKAKIFQPFFTTKPTGQGTGLGLSLSYDIVTKGHGGTLEVENVEGDGTTFVVKLPM